MADWVPVYRKAYRDPRMVELARACGVRLPEAIGLCALLWLALTDESPLKGELAHLSDATVEEWAGWRGRRSKFAKAYREQFQDAQGCVRHWDKYVGFMLDNAERERARKREWYRTHKRGTSALADGESLASGEVSGQSVSQSFNSPTPLSAGDAELTASAPAPSGAGRRAAVDQDPDPDDRTPEQREANARQLRELVIQAGLEPAPLPLEPQPAPHPLEADDPGPERAQEIETRRRELSSAYRQMKTGLPHG